MRFGLIWPSGIVAPVGPVHVGLLAAVVDGDDGALPAAVRELARLLLNQIESLSEKIAGLDAELRRRAVTDDNKDISFMR